MGCVLHAPVRRVGGGRGVDETIALVIGPDEPIPLRGAANVRLLLRLRYRLAPVEHRPGQWQATIISYQYTLLDQGQREILAFHLHPDGPSDVQTPHLHLGAGAGQLRPELAQAHVPTGPLTLAAVVRLAIEAFLIRPLRQDWDAVLSRCDAALAGSPNR